MIEKPQASGKFLAVAVRTSKIVRRVILRGSVVFLGGTAKPVFQTVTQSAMGQRARQE